MADKQNNGSQNELQPAPVRLPEPPACASHADRPPGMMRVTRTELVWPGKYNEDGTLKEVPRVSLPFQVIETVNETRATREAKKGGIQPGLFDVYEGKEGDSFEEGWKNKLIWGDNLLVMGSLLEKFAGKIDLIYIDPPFATGSDFSVSSQVGEDSIEVRKDASVLEEKVYRDTWGGGFDSYLDMLAGRLRLARELLSSSGLIFVHIGPNANHLVRMLMDDIFGADQHRNEVVWKRTFAHSDAKRFGIVHDSLLMYSRTESYSFTKQYRPHDESYIKSHYGQVDADGRRFRLVTLSAAGPGPARRFGDRVIEPSPGRHWAWGQERIDQGLKSGRIVFARTGQPNIKQYLEDTDGTVVQSVWDDIPPVNPISAELLDYATQKPELLIDRVLKTGSQPGDLVADFFCGSGTTMAVAEKLGRRWIGCDLGRWAVHVTRKRLLGIENCKPFEVLNLGKYERQYWQGVTFGEKRGRHITEQALYEYLAFILKLYGAQPVAGLVHLHGKKGRAMVHIGAVDAPVTIAEIDAAVDECVQFKQPELHVLGWEWEMGLYDLMVEAANKKGVKLVLLQIPREVMEQQAAAKGDVRFFELAYLEAEIQKPSPRPSPRGRGTDMAVQVALKDFVIPNTELIPEEVRSKIKKWSDYIDYWAVDWDFQNDTFMQGWVAFRTRKERKLPLVSDPHAYDKPGRYRILVKVIDIFGNDTSQAFDVEVPQ
jgi:adenine specific DNA methylase Mod